MRWTLPKDGDLRRRTRFLWIPKTINRESRWLQRATWFERYRETMFMARISRRWVPVEWDNDETEGA